MRVIICGAGIAGLSLGWWLANDGWDVLIVELSAGLRGDGYMLDFFGPGYDVAEIMGILPRLEELCYDVGKLVYVDNQGRSKSSLEYDVFRSLQRGRLMSFLRGDLERVLFESLPGRVEMRFGLTIEKVTEDPAGVRVTFSDGACETADLLVGADGLHSRTREIVFGDECQFLRYLGYHTAAYVFEDREVREALGADFVNLGVPDRNAGFYAVRGGKIASFFVHRAPDGSLTDAPCEELWQTYGDLGWILPRALAHCPACARVYYDQVAQVKMHQWSRGRVTLIGDACCAVSLLAGQGASIAIAAAFVLAVELRQARAVEEALFRYEDRLRPVVARQQRIGVKTAKWLVPSSRWMMKVRDLTLNLSRTPALSGLLRPLLAAGKESVVDHEHSRRAELLSKSS